MQAAVLLVSALTLVTGVEAVPQSAPPLPLSILPSPTPPPPPPPPATARSVALGVGYCRDASGNNAWNEDCKPNCPQTCLDTVQECGQACEATTDCACFAHTSPSANPNDAEGCKSAGSGRCVLYTGPAIATQSSGYVGYTDTTEPTSLHSHMPNALPVVTGAIFGAPGKTSAPSSSANYSCCCLVSPCSLT